MGHEHDQSLSLSHPQSTGRRWRHERDSAHGVACLAGPTPGGSTDQQDLTAQRDGLLAGQTPILREVS